MKGKWIMIKIIEEPRVICSNRESIYKVFA